MKELTTNSLNEVVGGARYRGMSGRWFRIRIGNSLYKIFCARGGRIIFK